ncbi:amidase [Salipiger sp. H15]|uniref:Amidase n=1 Tax=Alloyangia sp. H15 TaxID=3029062 RepID=A0AAU8AL56_9RHOB
MNFHDYAAMTARQIARAVGGGEVSAAEIARAALSRLDEVDPRLHAFVHVASDVIAQAERLDRSLAAGRRPGPLAGVPVAIKDLLPTRDMPTSFGSGLYRSHRSEVDEISVARLREAGAILLGKTNCSEFGYGGFGHNLVFPATRHPLDPALTSGGSSAGSAVAVATGICPVALGSDGGGSIRLPAAFTGLVGVKASMGRVPLWPGCRTPDMPGASGWETVEHVGPLARTAEDAALVLSVIAGPDPRDRYSIPSADIDWLGALSLPAPKGLRVAYCESWASIPVDPEIATTVRRAAARLCDALGARMAEIEAPDVPLELYRAVVAVDTDIAGLRRMAGDHPCALSANLRDVLGTELTPEMMRTARFGRMKAVNAMAELMQGHDLLMTPATACMPFAAGRNGPGEINGIGVPDDGWTPALFPMNLTGQPAVSVPAGLSSRGLPIGLQIAGRHLGDALVLQAAALNDRLTGVSP